MTKSFTEQARELELTTRLGDLVLVQAPAGSMGAQYNGHKGELSGFSSGGWVVVKLLGLDERRFRADELLVL